MLRFSKVRIRIHLKFELTPILLTTLFFLMKCGFIRSVPNPALIFSWRLDRIRILLFLRRSLHHVPFCAPYWSKVNIFSFGIKALGALVLLSLSWLRQYQTGIFVLLKQCSVLLCKHGLLFPKFFVAWCDLLSPPPQYYLLTQGWGSFPVRPWCLN